MTQTPASKNTPASAVVPPSPVPATQPANTPDINTPVAAPPADEAAPPAKTS